MPRQLLVLDEVLAMLSVVGVPQKHIAAFQTQAEAVVAKKPRTAVDNVTVSSGFGQKSQRGFVELSIDDTLTQMDAAKAREIGLMLLQASEAAQSDEIFVKLLEKIGIPRERSGLILLDLRELRQGTKGILVPVMKTYLGDSVYVDTWHDGLILTTENGRPDDPSNTIVLEPAVYSALVQFVEHLAPDPADLLDAARAEAEIARQVARADARLASLRDRDRRDD